MSKIKVNISELESAVMYFKLAAEESGEIDYRLKVLGNELTDDVNLVASPEYEAIIESFVAVSDAVKYIKDYFDSQLSGLITAPEKYYEADRKSKNAALNLVVQNKNVQSLKMNDSVFEDIANKVRTNKNDTKELQSLVNNSYTKLVLSEIGTESNLTENKKD